MHVITLRAPTVLGVLVAAESFTPKSKDDLRASADVDRWIAPHHKVGSVKQRVAGEDGKIVEVEVPTHEAVGFDDATTASKTVDIEDGTLRHLKKVIDAALEGGAAKGKQRRDILLAALDAAEGAGRKEEKGA